MVEWPFQYGREVLGSYFFDRQEDIEKLVTYLTKGKNDLAIYGARRIGKTSLIFRLSEVLKESGVLPIIIKCEKLLPLDELTFFGNLVNELNRQLTALNKKEKVKDLAKRVIPEKVGLTTGDIDFWIDFGKGEIKDIKRLMDKSFDLIERISGASGRKIVVFLDEFQELFPFGGKFLWALRAQISESKATFAVSSSYHHFVEHLTDEKHPFFNFFQLYHLEGVPDEDAEIFLRARVKKFGINYDEETIKKIITLSKGNPYYIQLLGFWCYEMVMFLNRKIIDEEVFKLAYPEALKGIPAHLISSFGKLKGRTKDVFVAMCVFELNSAGEIGRKINMPGNNVYQLLQQIESSYALVKKVGEGRFEVTDHFLKDYVKQMFE